MRRILIIAIGAVAALATAAVAVAAFTASGAGTTTAGFSADKANDVSTRTCAGADGKEFKVTNGRYTGQADFSDPATDLDGPLTISARTTVSTADGLGYVAGSFRVKDDDSRFSGAFWGTLKGDKLVGFLAGGSRGSHATVLGNLSATFVPGTGFTSGALGSTSSTSVLAVVAGPVCKGRKAEPKPAPKPEKPARPAWVIGDVTAVGNDAVGSTITVTSKGPSTATCTRDATSPSTAGFPVGTKVLMKCEKIGTTWTLRTLQKRG